MNALKYWNKTNEIKPEVGLEVLGFSKSWIDEDFNPDGIRACFLNENEDGYWMIAGWDACNDLWTTRYSENVFEEEGYEPSDPPTYWTTKDGNDFLQKALKDLFDQCKHGDQEHQDWLENKFRMFHGQIYN